MLCNYAFPDCVILSGDAAGLPLCYEDCIALRQHFCYSEWTHIVKQKERGINYKSRGHFRLPDCDSLPRIGVTNNTCTKTGITDMRWDLVTSKQLRTARLAIILSNYRFLCERERTFLSRNHECYERWSEMSALVYFTPPRTHIPT